MMRVGDCHRQGIRGVRPGDLHAGEQAGNHRLDLRFLGAAGSDHGLLDQSRRIFADFDPGVVSGFTDEASNSRRIMFGSVC